MSNTEIAATILDQIGGRRALAMTAGQAITKSRGLVLKLKANRRFFIVEIDLTAADDYTVTFRKFNSRTFATKLLSSHDGIFADALKGLIERETGLALSL